MRINLLLLIFPLALAAGELTSPLPSADDVVARMMEREGQRQSALHGYSAARRYVLENPHRQKHAEMLVKMECLEDGAKRFETVSASGWGPAQKHLFPRLLESESESSMPAARERSRITPQNYSFTLMGQENVNHRPAYVIAISPKTQNKYLVEGKIWVDLEDYAIVRIEGKPAKSPSFWIKSVHFVHTYRKSGSFWWPESDRSVSDVRIIGANILTIEYFDYALNPASLSAVRVQPKGNEP
jgi:hypothetical protein